MNRSSCGASLRQLPRRGVQCGGTPARRRAGVSCFRQSPGGTPEQIAGRIIVPHPEMPGVSLTAAEIRDIVAYIVSLKRNN